MMPADDQQDELQNVVDHIALRDAARAWRDTAAMHARNEQFYRGLLIEQGLALGTKPEQPMTDNWPKNRWC